MFIRKRLLDLIGKFVNNAFLHDLLFQYLPVYVE